MGAQRAASRVRLRRAAPALDPARCAGASHRTGIDSARLTPAIKVGPTPGDRTRAQMHRWREGAVGDEPIDGRAAQAGGLDDGRQARKHACQHGRALRCGGKSIHGGDCRTITRNSRRSLAVAKRRITAKNHRVRRVAIGGGAQFCAGDAVAGAAAFRRLGVAPHAAGSARAAASASATRRAGRAPRGMRRQRRAGSGPSLTSSSSFRARLQNSEVVRN